MKNLRIIMKIPIDPIFQQTKSWGSIDEMDLKVKGAHTETGFSFFSVLRLGL